MGKHTASAGPSGARTDIRPEQEDRASLLDAAVIERADCCSARPAFRAELPASADRRRCAVLLLCGHHYRAHTVALSRAGVRIFDFFTEPGLEQ